MLVESANIAFSAATAISMIGSAIDTLKDPDVSGMENKYAIAKNLLMEKHDEVNELLKIDYPKSFSFHMIQTWPIFIEYRKSEEYKTFINEHKSEYAEYELKE